MAKKKNEFSILDRIADTLEGMASESGESTASANTKLGMLNRIADALDEIAESGSGGGGSGAGPLIVHATTDSSNVTTLDKTWQEIHDAKFAVLIFEGREEYIGISLVTGISVQSGVYIIILDGNNFTCETADGYPSFDPSFGGDGGSSS